jgi:hypothetical protein
MIGPSAVTQNGTVLPIPVIPAGRSDSFRPPRRSGATLELRYLLPKNQVESSFNFFLMEPPFKLMRCAL